jgi:putative PEP-CTERM system TPR-repeat lipoprotein
MKILLIGRIVLIFSVFLLFACSDVDDKQLVVMAKKYIENNQLRAANLELKSALQANPKNAEARYLLGQLNTTIGDMASAAKEFRKAQEAGWDEAQAQIGLMNALVSSRKFEKVLNDIRIKDYYLVNARADLFGVKAFAEAASGFAGLARESIKQGVALDKEAFHVLKTGVQLDITRGKLDVAAVQIKHALSLYENNAELLLLSAYLSMRNSDDVAAAEQFEQIISMEPENFVTRNGRKARLGLARLEIRNKNMAHAESLLAPLFKQNANDPEVNYIGGLLSFEQAELDKAEERLLKVLKVAPDHAKSQLLFGSINFAQKDYEQTAYYIKKYLQLEPDNIGARKLLGRTYILMGQNQEAQAVLRPGMQSDDGDAELLALVGLSHLKGGDIASGITDLEKAVVAAPDSKALRGELAKAYISAGNTESAINQLNKIVAEGGNRNQAEVLIVSAHLRAKQYDKAIGVVLGIFDRSPQDITAMLLVGKVFAVSGDRVEARKYFNKVLEKEPDNFQATMLLAKLEEDEGRLGVAEGIYIKLSEKNPDSSAPMLALARLAAEKSDYLAMVSWLEKARERAPMEIGPRLALAEYYLRDKQFGKAGTLVDEALNISSSEPSLLLLKSRILLAQRRFLEALTPLKELVTRSPKSAYARSLLGETYMMLEQFDDARRQLNLVLKEQPYYVGALLALSRVEQLSENYKPALDYVERAIKVEPKHFPAYEVGGDISMAAKNYPAASKYYGRAQAIRPSSKVVIKQSQALMRHSETDQAIEILTAWLSEHADDVRTYEFLGGAYLENGRNAEAIQSFETVYKLQPKNIVALNNLAWLYSLNKDPRAIIYAEKAYAEKGNSSDIQDTYGWILVQQEQLEQIDKGRRILEKVIKELPDVPEVRYHYAVALYKSGEKIEAKRLLNKLLQSGQSFEGLEDAQKLMLQ